MKGTSRDDGLFSPVVLGFLIASVAAIFALSVLLSTMNAEETPFRATIASPSAIGHKGFYTLLQRLDYPIATSRINDTIEAPRGGLLIIDEPDRKLFSTNDESAIANAPDSLVILPKWTGTRDILHDGWISEAKLLNSDVPREVLKIFAPKASIVRAPVPRTFPRNLLGVAPKLTGPTQFITHSSLRPIIADGDKILVGEYSTLYQRIWILADPDALENHGIAKPENTHFALALVDRLRRGNGKIVFDETVHGAVAPDRNPIQLIFQFPYVIVTAQLIATLLLLLLATTARFGGAEEAPPPFALGKGRLIDNIAALMDRAGHQASILRRYISVKLAETARALHAPHGLDDTATAVWLDRVGKARGVGLKAQDILASTAGATGGRSRLLPRLFNEARDMYRYQKDMIDGVGGRPDNR